MAVGLIYKHEQVYYRFRSVESIKRFHANPGGKYKLNSL